MGILHLHLLVMFSTFLSVRSCPNTNGGNLCSGTPRSFGGKLVLLRGNGDHSNKNFVFQLPPVGERKFLNKWTAGIIRIRRIVTRTFCPANDRMVEYPGCGEVLCPAAWKPNNENDMTTTSGATSTETVTRTTPSTSTLDVTSTSPASNVTSTWHVQTGSRVRGHSFVTVQYQIDRTKCVIPQQCSLTLQRNTNCTNKRNKYAMKTTDDCNIMEEGKTFRGLQPDDNYKVILYVTCGETGKRHWISENIQTEESVPTAAPINITVKGMKGRYLIFKWEEPPCDGRNGNIANYDFIFIKIREGTKNIIHNVTPRNFVVFNRMKSGDVYRFKVMANTKRGFGVYSEVYCGVFDESEVSVSNCTNSE